MSFINKKVLSVCILFVGVLLCRWLFVMNHPGNASKISKYLKEYNKLIKSDIEADENAAGYYEKAVELFVSPGEKLQNLLATDFAYKDCLERDETIEWIDQNYRALEMLEKGTVKPYFVMEYKGLGLYELNFPLSLSKIESLVSAICLRALIKADKGDFLEAFSDIMVGYKFTRHWIDKKTIIEQCLALKCRSRVLKTIRDILQNYEIANDKLIKFQDDLNKALHEEKVIADFTYEKYKFFEIIDLTFSDEGGIKESKKEYYRSLFKNDGAWTKKIDQEGFWEGINKKGSLNTTEKIFNYIDEVKTQIPAKWHDRNESVEEALNKIINDNPVLYLSIFNAEAFLEKAYFVRTETEAVINIFALMRYKNEKGNFPDSLNQLKAENYIDSVAIDAFSGKALIYKKTNASFVLYTVGSNYRDDGGEHSNKIKELDYIFWPVMN